MLVPEKQKNSKNTKQKDANIKLLLKSKSAKSLHSATFQKNLSSEPLQLQTLNPNKFKKTNNSKTNILGMLGLEQAMVTSQTTGRLLTQNQQQMRQEPLNTQSTEAIAASEKQKCYNFEMYELVKQQNEALKKSLYAAKELNIDRDRKLRVAAAQIERLNRQVQTQKLAAHEKQLRVKDLNEQNMKLKQELMDKTTQIQRWEGVSRQFNDLRKNYHQLKKQFLTLSRYIQDEQLM